jgi:hypothetical protein
MIDLARHAGGPPPLVVHCSGGHRPNHRRSHRRSAPPTDSPRLLHDVVVRVIAHLVGVPTPRDRAGVTCRPGVVSLCTRQQLHSSLAIRHLPRFYQAYEQSQLAAKESQVVTLRNLQGRSIGSAKVSRPVLGRCWGGLLACHRRADPRRPTAAAAPSSHRVPKVTGSRVIPSCRSATTRVRYYTCLVSPDA